MAFTLGCTRWVAASIHFMLPLPGGTPLAVVLAGAAQLHWFSGRGAAASRHMLCQSLNHCPLILLATALARRHHRTFSMTSTTSTASGQCMRGMT
jgi:hypothetical protein|eukprot:COSAG06_NODE_1349_length_9776_cov_110.373049_10_plen_95_part_00